MDTGFYIFNSAKQGLNLLASILVINLLKSLRFYNLLSILIYSASYGILSFFYSRLCSNHLIVEPRIPGFLFHKGLLCIGTFLHGSSLAGNCCNEFWTSSKSILACKTLWDKLHPYIHPLQYILCSLNFII